MKFRLVEDYAENSDGLRIFMSDDPVDIKHAIKPGVFYRLVYHKPSGYYLLSDDLSAMHGDIYKVAINNGGLEPGIKNIMHITLGTTADDASAMTDNYTYKYVYDSGINVYCYEEGWENLELATLLGNYESFVMITQNRGYEKITPHPKRGGLFRRK